MVEVDVDYSADVLVGATPAEAFALLSDVHASGSHFPGLASLTAVDSHGRWRWTMKEKGFGPVKIAATYEALYDCDADAMRVDWKPAPGRNDMESFGSWEIIDGDAGTMLRFHARTIAHIPAPRLMNKMVDAFVKEELSGLKRDYVQAIKATLDAAVA